MTWLQVCSRYVPVRQSRLITGTAESKQHLGFHCNQDQVFFMGRVLSFLLLLPKHSDERDASCF